MLEQRTDEILGRVGEAASGTADVESRLRAAVVAYFDYVAGDPFVHRVLARDESAEPEIADAVARCDRRATAAVAALLASDEHLLAGDADRNRSLELMAQMLRTGLNGLAAWWRADPSRTRDELVEAATRLTWTGLSGLRPPERRRAGGRGEVRRSPQRDL